MSKLIPLAMAEEDKHLRHTVIVSEMKLCKKDPRYDRKYNLFYCKPTARNLEEGPFDLIDPVRRWR